MELNKDKIIFNPEERWIGGLPESIPIADANEAFAITRRARECCYAAFKSLLTCDFDLVTDDEMKTLPLYPNRLGKLDELSQKLAGVIAPQMIAQLQENPAALADSVSHIRE
jgi:hypothetical protein